MDRGAIRTLMPNRYGLSHEREDLRGKLASSVAFPSPVLALLLAACGGGGGGGAPQVSNLPSSTQTASGSLLVFDGPVRGATVWLDINQNKQIDPADIELGVTGGDGRYSYSRQLLAEHVTGGRPNKPLIVDLRGATDIGDPTDPSDDKTFSEGSWRAPVGSTIISPLTHLLEETTHTVSTLASALGLPQGFDITRFDPYREQDSENSRRVLVAGEVVAEEIARMQNGGASVEFSPEFIRNLPSMVEERINPPPEPPPPNSVATMLAENGDSTNARMVTRDELGAGVEASGDIDATASGSGIGGVYSFTSDRGSEGVAGYGGFIIGTNGMWEYNINPAMLTPGGNDLTESITISFDPTDARYMDPPLLDLVFTIEQPPLIATTLTESSDSTNARMVTRDELGAGVEASGDIDATASGSGIGGVYSFTSDRGSSGVAGYGGFIIGTNGMWEYNIDPARLTEGGPNLTENITISFDPDGEQYMDPSSLTLTFTIEQPPLIATTLTESSDSTNARMVTRDELGAGVEASGDIDATASGSGIGGVYSFTSDRGSEGVAGYGGFIIGTNGMWEYNINPAMLTPGGSDLTESITISFDPTDARYMDPPLLDLVFTIEQPPLITTILTESADSAEARVVEQSELGEGVEARGDIDATAAGSGIEGIYSFASDRGSSGVAGYGGFIIGTNGMWEYNIDPARLTEGGPNLTENITISFDPDGEQYMDPSSLTLTFTIEQPPLIATTLTESSDSTNARMVTRDELGAGVEASGDIDATASGSGIGGVYSFTSDRGSEGVAGYGGFIIGTNGMWEYNINPAMLTPGGSDLTESITISFDPTDARYMDPPLLDLVFTIEQPPLITTILTESADSAEARVVEQSELGEGVEARGDIDATAAGSGIEGIYSFASDRGSAGVAGYGSFIIDADGMWAYDIDPALLPSSSIGLRGITEEVITISFEPTDPKYMNPSSLSLTFFIEPPPIPPNSIATMLEESADSTGARMVTRDELGDGDEASGDIDVTATSGSSLFGRYSFTSDRGGEGVAGYGTFYVRDDGLWVYDINIALLTPGGANITEVITISFDPVGEEYIDPSPLTLIFTIEQPDSFATILAESADSEVARMVMRGELGTGIEAMGDIDATGREGVVAGTYTFTSDRGSEGVAGYGTFSINADGMWQYDIDHSRLVQGGRDLTESITIRFDPTASQYTDPLPVILTFTIEQPDSTRKFLNEADGVTSVQFTTADFGSDFDSIFIILQTLFTDIQPERGIFWLDGEILSPNDTKMIDGTEHEGITIPANKLNALTFVTNDRLGDSQFVLRYRTESDGIFSDEFSSITIVDDAINDVPTISYTANSSTELAENSNTWESIGRFIVIDNDWEQNFSVLDHGFWHFRFNETIIPNGTTGAFSITDVGKFRIRKDLSDPAMPTFVLEAKELVYGAVGLTNHGYTFSSVKVNDTGNSQSNVISNVVTFTVTETPANTPIRFEIHEYHPLKKVIHDWNTPSGFVDGGTWTLEDVSGAVGDSAPFRVDMEGRIWADALSNKSLLDYENPQDSNEDNTYQLNLVYTESGVGGRRYEERVDIVVQDIVREFTIRTYSTSREKEITVNGDYSHAYRFSYDQLESLGLDELQGDSLVPYILGLGVHRMPLMGPLQLSWSFGRLLHLKESGIRREMTEEEVAFLREMVESVFDEIESVVNIEFVEIHHDYNEYPGNIEGTVGQIQLNFDINGRKLYTPGTSYNGISSAGGSLDSTILDVTSSKDTLVHEIMHVLGFKHPFEFRTFDDRGFPSDEKYRYDKTISITSYADDQYLTETDIAALQLLYGAPGTNFAGLESKFSERAPATPSNSGIRYIKDESTTESTSNSEGDPRAWGILAVYGPAPAISYDARQAGTTDDYIFGRDSANGGKGAKIDGIYGSLYLKPSGAWVYELDNERDATNNLASRQSKKDIFEIRAKNGPAPHTNAELIYSSEPFELEITVNGADDLNLEVINGSIQEGTTNTRTLAILSLNGEASGWSRIDISGDTLGLFEIVQNRLQLKRGIVLDYETESHRSHSVTLSAVDSEDETLAQADFTLSVTNRTDEDTNYVRITSGSEGVMLPENQNAGGMVVYTPTYEANPTNQIRVKYTTRTPLSDEDMILSFANRGQPIGGNKEQYIPFKEVEGTIVVRDNFSPDYEYQSSYSFTVWAYEINRHDVFATKEITIRVQDAEDPITITSGDEGSRVLVDNQLVGSTPVYNATATAENNEAVTWSLADQPRPRFEIDSNGVVTVRPYYANVAVNYERQSSYSFTVVATLDSDPAVQSRKDVTIKIQDASEEEFFLRFTSNDDNIVLPEDQLVESRFPDSANGYLRFFHTFTTESDVGTSNELSISRGDSHMFHLDLDPSRGNDDLYRLRFRDLKFVPDYEDRDSYTFLVTVEHPLDDTITKEKWVTIRIENDPEDDPQPDSIETDATELSIYENHPTHKDVLHDLGESRPDTQGFALTEGYKDNALFEISADGRIWWKAHPDFETPQDGGTNNLYQIEVMRTEADSSVVRHHFAITVEDIRFENTFKGGGRRTVGDERRFSISRDEFSPEELPRVEIQEIMLGYYIWKRSYPEEGPITITWSLEVDENESILTPDNQLAIDNAREVFENAFAEFEQAANLKFIEVMQDDTRDPGARVGDISVLVPLRHIFGGLGGGNFVLVLGDRDGNVSNSTAVHEIAHSLGLDHPFESTGLAQGWLAAPNKHRDPNTIMSYYGHNRDQGLLLPMDIEALQYLYGAPGDDDGGIENLLDLI